MAKPTVAIIGASSTRSKFGNKSLRAHAAKGYEVFPVNPNESVIEGLKAYPNITSIPVPIDRVSMYVHPTVGLTLIDEIAKCQPGEIWLNPGAESHSLIQRCRELGLNLIVGCSIVQLGVSPGAFPD